MRASSVVPGGGGEAETGPGVVTAVRRPARKGGGSVGSQVVLAGRPPVQACLLGDLGQAHRSGLRQATEAPAIPASAADSHLAALKGRLVGALPAVVDVCFGCAGARPPQSDRLVDSAAGQFLHDRVGDGALDDDSGRRGRAMRPGGSAAGAADRTLVRSPSVVRGAATVTVAASWCAPPFYGWGVAPGCVHVPRSGSCGVR
jgi:hypothetical protein